MRIVANRQPFASDSQLIVADQGNDNDVANDLRMISTNQRN